MLSTLFVLLTVDWMFRLARPYTSGWIVRDLLVFAIIGMAAQLIALGVATAQRIHGSRRVASVRAARRLGAFGYPDARHPV
jgi:hypothetical protein